MSRSRRPPEPSPIRVLIAPDSFKGSLTSVEVATALASGWQEARPGDEVLLAPLADGGEGTLVAIEAAGGWSWESTPATDPIGRPVAARWLRSADGARAVVELAEASGLSRLAASELDPVGASTRGTGEVLRAVIDAGVRSITLGIGGSATTDGGAGILAALGVRIEAGGIALDELDRRLADVELRIACDVTNPLLGPTGAAATYGPQKGATPQQVRDLDAALGRFAEALESAAGRRERATPGAGAAGGTGFGLLSLKDRFRSLELVSGIDVVMDAADFAGKLVTADVVLTGEGRIDAQTAFGKTALGVAQHAAAAGVPCIAIGGGIDAEGEAVLAKLGAITVSVSEAPMTLEAAMAAGAEPVRRCGRRIARLISLGRLLDGEGRGTPDGRGQNR
ncbi:MAG TPA: glycerate kinase [Candidatus Limnocylindrales bacterium]|nr:glycerate kinase [Candidatus Limnocylindrales bacterium]